MDATRRQRTLRAATLMLLGVCATLAVSLDPAAALRTASFWALAVPMLVWTVAENLALQQDEPRDYEGKRNTRILQAVVIGTAAIASVDRYHLPALTPRSFSVAAAGALLIVAGAALRVLAIRVLARHFTYELRVEREQRIVERGPYRWIRHPSYLGLLLLTAGEAVAMSSLLALVVGVALALAVVVQRIRIEERILRNAFGGAYEAYTARTWALLPGVY